MMMPTTTWVASPKPMNAVQVDPWTLALRCGNGGRAPEQVLPKQGPCPARQRPCAARQHADARRACASLQQAAHDGLDVELGEVHVGLPAAHKHDGRARAVHHGQRRAHLAAQVPSADVSFTTAQSLRGSRAVQVQGFTTAQSLRGSRTVQVQQAP